MDTIFLNEHRCQCGKLLLKGIFFDATLQIKCKKCGTINTIGVIKLEDDATHYILIINNRGIITNVSDSIYKMLGYNNEELIGKYFTKINPTLTPELGKKFFGPDSILNTENHFKLETFHRHKSGKNIPVTVFLKLYQSNGKEKFVLVSAKVGKAKSDKKIDNKNTLSFIENACDYYFDIDKNGIAECVSPSVEKLFGFTPEMVIGKNYFDFIPDEMKVRAKKRFDTFLVKQLPFRIDSVGGKDVNGKPVFSEQYFTPTFSDAGIFTGYRVLGWLPKKTKKPKN